MEVGVQRNALKDVEKPCNDGKHGVESHGPVNQILEGFVGRKAEVE